MSSTLTPLADVLARWLEPIAPAAPRFAPLRDALGAVAASSWEAAHSCPEANMALRDGWALRADDIAGASSYAPVLPALAPVWVEAGGRLPPATDCVVDPQGVETMGSILQVVLDSFPGENVRRAGDDLPAGAPLDVAGRMLSALDLALAAQMGLAEIAIRRPAVAIVATPPADGPDVTADLVARLAATAGAEVTRARAVGRSRSEICDALTAQSADLVVLVGGTGEGRTDASVGALADAGDLLAHGLAIRPGRSAAVGRIGACPVLALPGLPAQALAVWWALGESALDKLTGRRRTQLSLPLAGKISSTIGLVELVLLLQQAGTFRPLAVGDAPLRALAAATHACFIAAGSEGHAPGAAVSAFPIRMDIDND